MIVQGVSRKTQPWNKMLIIQYSLQIIVRVIHRWKGLAQPHSLIPEVLNYLHKLRNNSHFKVKVRPSFVTLLEVPQQKARYDRKGGVVNN